MGFTRWPADLTLEGANTAQNFAHRQGDIVSVMLIGGVPWPEALNDKPYSADVRRQLDYRPPKGKKLFLSISPLNKDRTDIAPYWGARDNLPLPTPWNTRPLDSAEVKAAYRNFVLNAVARMRPDFLAIGIELNVLLSNDPAKWLQVKELYRETYVAVKAKHPRLPVFFTTEVLHYKKLAAGSQDKDQAGEVAELMQQSDMFAMSLYPHMSYATPRPLPLDFLDFARGFGKPIAVSESGMTSRNVELKTYGVTLRGSEAEQWQFTDFLLRTAARDNYRFVIMFATTDFEKLIARLPAAVQDLARVWAFTGLQTSAKKPKLAFALWRAWLLRPLARPGGVGGARRRSPASGERHSRPERGV
jgi:hypothetical protein